MTDTTAGEGGLAAQLRRRLDDLKGQFEKGRARLGQLEAEAGELRQTLTRIAERHPGARGGAGPARRRPRGASGRAVTPPETRPSVSSRGARRRPVSAGSRK